MQSTSLAFLKKEIPAMPKAELIEVCIRLIKYKKENKALLHYLLFESLNEPNYALQLKNEVTILFQDVNTQTVYFAKKPFVKFLDSLLNIVNFLKTQLLKLITNCLKRVM